jgi:hypothetical protein
MEHRMSNDKGNGNGHDNGSNGGYAGERPRYPRCR